MIVVLIKTAISYIDNFKMPYLIILFFQFFIFCANASVTLSPVNVSTYQKAFYQEALRLAIQGGAPLEKQSFSLSADDKTLGVFIAGEGFNEHDDKTCFIGWATQPEKIDVLIPTIGKENWEAEVCGRTVAVGILSKDNEHVVKIGVIYDAQSPAALVKEVLIFSVDKEKQVLSLDRALTNQVSTEEVTTLSGLRQWYQNQPSAENITLNNVVLQVEKTVESQKIITQPACVNYLLTKDAEPGIDLVNVVEKHGGACPGDPETQPRLFSVYVDQKTKQMMSDKDDPVEGNLSLLEPAK